MDVVKADLGVEQKTSSKLDAEMHGIIEEVLSTDITNAEARRGRDSSTRMFRGLFR